MTNSNSNTPNSGFNTAGTQRQRAAPLTSQQVNAQTTYGKSAANYVREQEDDDEELSSAYMSKQYLHQGNTQSHHMQGNTTNPFQTRKPETQGDNTIGRDHQNKLFSYNPAAMRSNYTGAPQTP